MPGTQSNSNDTIIVEPSLISVDEKVADVHNIRVFVNKNSIEPIAIKAVGIKDDKRHGGYQLVNIADYYNEETFEFTINVVKKGFFSSNDVELGKLNIKISAVIDDIE